MTPLTSPHTASGREKTNERGEKKGLEKRGKRWEDEEVGARRKKRRGK